MELFAIFAIVIAMVIFAYQVKVPIYYIFSGVIAMAGSIYLFNIESGITGNGPESSYVMFAIIFILISVWQLGEALRGFIQ